MLDFILHVRDRIFDKSVAYDIRTLFSKCIILENFSLLSEYLEFYKVGQVYEYDVHGSVLALRSLDNILFITNNGVLITELSDNQDMVSGTCFKLSDYMGNNIFSYEITDDLQVVYV